MCSHSWRAASRCLHGVSISIERYLLSSVVVFIWLHLLSVKGWIYVHGGWNSLGCIFFLEWKSLDTHRLCQHGYCNGTLAIVCQKFLMDNY